MITSVKARARLLEMRRKGKKDCLRIVFQNRGLRFLNVLREKRTDEGMKSLLSQLV